MIHVAVLTNYDIFIVIRYPGRYYDLLYGVFLFIIWRLFTLILKKYTILPACLKCES